MGQNWDSEFCRQHAEASAKETVRAMPPRTELLGLGKTPHCPYMSLWSCGGRGQTCSRVASALQA